MILLSSYVHNKQNGSIRMNERMRFWLKLSLKDKNIIRVKNYLILSDLLLQLNLICI